MSDQSSGGQADRISAEIAAVCGELLISPESAIRHTQESGWSRFFLSFGLS
jgi:hypothetical protein